ncbi:MAG: hypothetical protein Kow0063_07230 [Anaerolineae bacterium]
MAIEYPDIISEYVDASRRYETDGVQIAPYLEPAEIAVGGVTNLILLLQSAVDVPVEVSFKPDLPQTSRFRGAPMLAVKQTELSAALEPAQVGILIVPVATTPRAREGQHQIHLNVSVKVEGRPTRVRAQETRGRFRSDLIDDVVGLGLARVVSVPYTATPSRRISLTLTVRGKTEAEGEEPDLATRFQSLWSLEDIRHQTQAMQEISQRRATIIDQLKTEPLFVALFVEGQERVARTNQVLRIGEAIALGKILTYTARYFLANSDLQDGLLVPIWELANEYDLPTGDPLWVVRNVGFHHLLRLSVALSFGLIRQAIGRHPWTKEERRAVVSLVADSIESGQPLQTEFLYIPLLMAAAYISPQIKLDGEDSQHSLRLLQKAKAARADTFSDPDLAEANLIFNRMMDAAMRR